MAIDPAARTVDLKRPADMPHPRAHRPAQLAPDHGPAGARLSSSASGSRITASMRPGPYRAARDLLLGRPPRSPRLGDAAAPAGRNRPGRGAPPRPRARRTCSPIQGPPGSGKTYTGARMICTLLARGQTRRRHGMSHKVIRNLLSAVLRPRPPRHGSRFGRCRTGGRRQARRRSARDAWRQRAEGSSALADGRRRSPAGPRGCGRRRRCAESVDVLFVDEAGQMSLANVLAVARASDSIVLLGDPQQLDQPLQGSHPPGADRSALAHLLGGAATMPPDRGLFLETHLAPPP